MDLIPQIGSLGSACILVDASVSLPPTVKYFITYKFLRQRSKSDIVTVFDDGVTIAMEIKHAIARRVESKLPSLDDYGASIDARKIGRSCD